MINDKISEMFNEMADILQMQGVEWKPRAYRQAARAIEALRYDLEKIYKKGGVEKLEKIPTIGENLAGKIAEYIETGRIKEYERLKRSVPKHINVMLKIPGMGPMKVKKLNEVLKISTVAQLERAVKAHKIASIPGFGEKSEADILESIGLMRKSKGRIPLRSAQKQANEIVNQLKKLKEVRKIEVAGSLRRKKPTIGDIDIMVSSTKPGKVIDAFTKMKGIQKVVAKGSTKGSVILKSGMQADVRVLAPESWGAGLFYFTGSKNFNIEMRKVAIKLGYKLSEYGLFDKKTGKMIAGKTERDICKKLGVKYPEPEEREM